MIRGRGARFLPHDLGSANGTFVNGVRIQHPVRIEAGDEISFGAARFAVVGGRGRRSGMRRWKIAAAVAVLCAIALGGFQFTRNWEQALELKDSGPAVPAAKSIPTFSQHGIAKTAAPGSAPHLASVTDVTRVSTAPPSSSAPKAARTEWLERVNWYRAMLKLAPITDKADLSAGDFKHAEYLVRNYGAAIRSGADHGIDAHMEDPKNQWYSDDGAKVAARSDLDYIWGDNVAPTPAEGIDRWMAGAFHRMFLLNPALKNAGYGLYCQDGFCIQSLDVNDGDEDRALWNLAGVLRFPPPASTVPIGTLAGETPSPIAACPGYQFPVGIPVTLELGMHVKAELTSYSMARVGVSGNEPVEVCGYNGWAYSNENQGEQLFVSKQMIAFGAVAVIPRHPLKPGARYQVEMQVSGRDYKWSFAVAPAAAESAARR